MGLLNLFMFLANPDNASANDGTKETASDTGMYSGEGEASGPDQIAGEQQNDSVPLTMQSNDYITFHQQYQGQPGPRIEPFNSVNGPPGISYQNSYRGMPSEYASNSLLEADGQCTFPPERDRFAVPIPSTPNERLYHSHPRRIPQMPQPEMQPMFSQNNVFLHNGGIQRLPNRTHAPLADMSLQRGEVQPPPYGQSFQQQVVRPTLSGNDLHYDAIVLGRGRQTETSRRQEQQAPPQLNVTNSQFNAQQGYPIPQARQQYAPAYNQPPQGRGVGSVLPSSEWNDKQRLVERKFEAENDVVDELVSLLEQANRKESFKGNANNRHSNNNTAELGRIQNNYDAPAVFLDAVLVYDRSDYSTAKELVTELKRIVHDELGIEARIELFDSEVFSSSIVAVIEEAVTRSSVIFIFLTDNFDWNTPELELFCTEAIAMTRLGYNQQSYSTGTVNNARKWVVTPVHTQPKEMRSYRTPVGLLTQYGIDWYDWNSQHTRNRVVSIMKEAIRQRKHRDKDRFPFTYGDRQPLQKRTDHPENIVLPSSGQRQTHRQQHVPNTAFERAGNALQQGTHPNRRPVLTTPANQNTCNTLHHHQQQTRAMEQQHTEMKYMPSYQDEQGFDVFRGQSSSRANGEPQDRQVLGCAEVPQQQHVPNSDANRMINRDSLPVNVNPVPDYDRRWSPAPPVPPNNPMPSRVSVPSVDMIESGFQNMDMNSLPGITSSFSDLQYPNNIPHERRQQMPPSELAQVMYHPQQLNSGYSPDLYNRGTDHPYHIQQQEAIRNDIPSADRTNSIRPSQLFSSKQQLQSIHQFQEVPHVGTYEQPYLQSPYNVQDTRSVPDIAQNVHNVYGEPNYASLQHHHTGYQSNMPSRANDMPLQALSSLSIYAPPSIGSSQVKQVNTEGSTPSYVPQSGPNSTNTGQKVPVPGPVSKVTGKLITAPLSSNDLEIDHAIKKRQHPTRSNGVKQTKNQPEVDVRQPRQQVIEEHHFYNSGDSSSSSSSDSDDDIPSGPSKSSSRDVTIANCKYVQFGSKNVINEGYQKTNRKSARRKKEKKTKETDRDPYESYKKTMETSLPSENDGTSIRSIPDGRKDACVNLDNFDNHEGMPKAIKDKDTFIQGVLQTPAHYGSLTAQKLSSSPMNDLELQTRHKVPHRQMNVVSPQPLSMDTNRQPSHVNLGYNVVENPDTDDQTFQSAQSRVHTTTGIEDRGRPADLLTDGGPPSRIPFCRNSSFLSLEQRFMPTRGLLGQIRAVQNGQSAEVD